MLNLTLIITLAIIAGTLIYASTKPDLFQIERSINIKAPPETIFPLINDLRSWDAWTPYNKDPSMNKIYSGSNSGKGAHYAWEGNKNVGAGDITISESMPPHKLVLDLHMIKPFEGRNVAQIHLSETSDFTIVTWSLTDKHNLMLKIVSLFVNLDNVVGKDFEVGLANLKNIAEQ